MNKIIPTNELEQASFFSDFDRKKKVNPLTEFLSVNKKALIGMVSGFIIGYLYWYFWGCYWGVYPLSAECWVNCLAGLLFGGFIGSLMNEI